MLAAAKEMGYRANHGARAMRTGNTRMIGTVGGDLATEHVGAMVAGALEELEARGYTLKLLPSPQGGSLEAVQDRVRRSSELRLQGAIALHLAPNAVAAFEAEARRYKYPLVLLDTVSSGAALCETVSDDERGISDAIEHLFALGHRRIGLIGGDPNDAVVPLREAAFRANLRRRGLDEAPDGCGYGDFSLREPSLRAARALLERPAARRPTAIVCMGDLIAMAAIQSAAALGLRVPRDLSVVGFADFAVAKFANPPLTTVRQEFGAMGAAAARQLLQLCESPDQAKQAWPADDSFQCQRVPTQLIVRGTTGPVPK